MGRMGNVLKSSLSILRDRVVFLHHNRSISRPSPECDVSAHGHWAAPNGILDDILPSI